VSEREAAIHDLGYQRYAGGRRPQHTRWQVIVRNMVSMSWKGWWRYKVPLAVAVMTMVGIGVGIYFSRNDIFDAAPGMGEQVRTIADSLIPRSYTWFGFSALIIGLTVLAGTISRDLQAGAFEFYFSRPVRPLDYVIGKLVGAFMLLAPIILLGPLLLTIYRMGLTGDVDRVADTISWIPRAFLVGVVATLALASVALAFGAFTTKSRYAVVGYAAFMFFFGPIPIMAAIAHGVGIPELAALSPNSAILGFAAGVFEVDLQFGAAAPPLGISTASLLGYTTASILLILARVRQAQRSGMGGG
jgi:ABC-2 type transport system permease protein